jgi:hypothetical protein
VTTVLDVPDGVTADRAALARAVLARAERRTGARSAVRVAGPVSSVQGARTTPVPGVSAPVAVPAAVPAAGPVAVPAVVSAAGPAAVSAVPTGFTTVQQTERPPLPVDPRLVHLLPDGGLRRGGTLVVTGSTSLVLALVAEASRDGSWVAVVGMPGVGLLAARQSGVELDRLALVPAPGPDAPIVLAALVDGVDVVVVGPQVALTDADRRRLVSRARDRGAVLLSTSAWAGAHLVLSASPAGWSGLGAGHGHLRSQRLTVTRGGRGGAARPHRDEVVLPLGRGTAATAGAGQSPAVPDADLGVDAGASRPLRLVG